MFTGTKQVLFTGTKQVLFTGTKQVGSIFTLATTKQSHVEIWVNW